ncbi:GNAT family N-acetyltransferase [Nocardia xishanensis]|uniref:GNAT family N-acetyltransferase n=1 Tax=Nocardia xishanensis TaxID=238964 RepID=UPI0008298AB8|nr:GNAT family N-acetyltransferase [Nocardia xishanensis]
MALQVVPADPSDSGVTDLLFTAIGGDRSRLAAAVRRYRDDSAAHLVAAIVDDELAGVAGYVASQDHAVLLHIATRESHRRDGIGRSLLAEIRSRIPGRSVIAETDRDALAFYLGTGFEAVSLGEKYPGVERFEVRWAPASD